VNVTSEISPGLGDRACNGDSSDTWADRDMMRSAVEDFCTGTSRQISERAPRKEKPNLTHPMTDIHKTNGSAGTTTNAIFNAKSLDELSISIDWDETGAIEEHSCMAWLNIITDGCDVPDGMGANSENLKHGGSLAYYSDNVNATFNIETLVTRRIWAGGQASEHNCSDEKYYHVDRTLLQSNVEDYCVALSEYSGGIAEAGSVFSQVFNEDSADRVELKIEWPTGQRNFQIFKEECQSYMGVI
jgi:hypothetical protein